MSNDVSEVLHKPLGKPQEIAYTEESQKMWDDIQRKQKQARNKAKKEK